MVLLCISCFSMLRVVSLARFAFECVVTDIVISCLHVVEAHQLVIK